MAVLLTALTNAEIQSKLVEDKMKVLAKSVGKGSVYSGLFGCSTLARHKTQSELGQDSFVKIKTGKYEEDCQFARGAKALARYQVWLKYYMEQLVGRPLN